MISVRRTAAIARKEWLQLRRDTRSLILAFGVPLQLLLLFGYAISWDVRNVPLAVVDQDRSATSRALVDAFQANGYFDIVRSPARTDAAAGIFERGRAQAMLVIPIGFEKDVVALRHPALQLLVDGADANTATIALGYAQATVATWSASLAGGTTVGAGAPAVRVWYNETLESRNMLIPGLVASIMMLVAAMLSALTLAREWERGTMEQLIATPVDPREVVIGKLIPYLGIGMADVAMTVGAGVLVFRVPFRGDLLLLAVASFIFLLGTCAFGLWIGAVAKTQRLAIQLNMLTTYLPSFLLSGASIDLAPMPRVLQLLSFAVPARYFVVVLKGVVLKGVGFATLWPELAALGVYAVITIGLGTHAFVKRLA